MPANEQLTAALAPFDAARCTRIGGLEVPRTLGLANWGALTHAHPRSRDAMRTSGRERAQL